MEISHLGGIVTLILAVLVSLVAFSWLASKGYTGSKGSVA